MRQYQERVIKEKKELDSRLKKLEIFISGERHEDLDHEEQHLLTDQAETMKRYSRILGNRIKLFSRI